MALAKQNKYGGTQSVSNSVKTDGWKVLEEIAKWMQLQNNWSKFI